MRLLSVLLRTLRLAAVMSLSCLLLSSSSISLSDQTERVRAFTRPIEFDYVGWTLNAVRVKIFEASLGTANYMSADARHRFVVEYLRLIADIQQLEGQLKALYGDPSIPDPWAASAPLRTQLSELYFRRERASPLAESILQSQVSVVVSRLGLTLGGQPIPPVSYHSTPLPLALIVSPRHVIRQDEDISLLPTLTLDQQVELEQRVDKALNVSSLVVEIGGVGTYPTMVMQATSLDWLSEVIAHEWVHNFLTLRPLGIHYYASPELRTMNETAASIAGREIGRAVLEFFYPELIPATPAPESTPPKPGEQPAFDFRKEMHKTRVTVDQLLAQGKIEQAEAYMEERRLFFWMNGYRHLRKLNQAYFAFYGAYADEPGGAAGEDPVGAAVRSLRAQSPSLAAFLNRISWMYSYAQLQQAVSLGS